MRTESVATALVVEDDANWLGILRDELLSAGYKLDWASDRDEALRKVAAPPFDYDVVLLDPNLDDNLGGLSGRAVAESLAARAPRTPVVLISGFATSEALTGEYADSEVTIRGIFEKGSFDLAAFRALLLDLQGVGQASEVLFSCDREALKASWDQLKALAGSHEKGLALEEFAIGLLSGIPLLTFAERRVRTQTGEIDAVFHVSSIAGTLCQEWGGHLLVECRNRTDKFDSAAVSGFAQTLQNVDAKVGIVVSMAGVTGRGERDARGQIARVFQRERRIIIVLDETDIHDIVVNGGNLYEILRERDMAVRLGA